MLIVMIRFLSLFIVVSLSLVGSTVGQYFPPKPDGVKTVESKNYKGVKISYKEMSLSLHVC